MKIKTFSEKYINKGLPEIDLVNQKVSIFEFAPSWFFYTPVIIQSIFIGIFRRDLLLPLYVNPSIHLSGLVGESKDDVFNSLGNKAKALFLPYIKVKNSYKDREEKINDIKNRLEESKISFPLIAKPDIGCRGRGVKVIDSTNDIKAYMDDFPFNEYFLLQKKSEYSAEAGIFCIRDNGKFKIFSLGFKYRAVVYGDGKKTLNELIKNDKRAKKLYHLYKKRNIGKKDKVIGKGEEVPLSFTGSHSLGAIFKDGNSYITESLTNKIEESFKGSKGFNYGRIDIKFHDLNSLILGGDFDIMEINGISSEPVSIWDESFSAISIFRNLLFLYRVLYKIGYKNKKKETRSFSLKNTLGFIGSLKKIYHSFKKERELIKKYPYSD